MLFYLVILQLDMPSIVNNHGRLAPSEQKQRTNGSEWGGGMGRENGGETVLRI